MVERDPEIGLLARRAARTTCRTIPIMQSRTAFSSHTATRARCETSSEKPAAGRGFVDGQSVGRWKARRSSWTRRLNGMAWLDRSGNFTSDRVKVTERYSG
jgi:hypothetical protein